ncbi:MAG TPA: hypothetical protein VIM19_14015 [Actinomycetes bacterium]
MAQEPAGLEMESEIGRGSPVDPNGHDQLDAENVRERVAALVGIALRAVLPSGQKMLSARCHRHRNLVAA